jgi:hypothetical protein
VVASQRTAQVVGLSASTTGAAKAGHGERDLRPLLVSGLLLGVVADTAYAQSFTLEGATIAGVPVVTPSGRRCARSDPLFELDALPHIVELGLDRIDAHPDQPRKIVDPETLAASIERHGLLPPIVVQPAAAESYVLAED